VLWDPFEDRTTFGGSGGSTEMEIVMVEKGENKTTKQPTKQRANNNKYKYESTKPHCIFTVITTL